jgi:hypothetical protein
MDCFRIVNLRSHIATVNLDYHPQNQRAVIGSQHPYPDALYMAESCNHYLYFTLSGGLMVWL